MKKYWLIASVAIIISSCNVSKVVVNSKYQSKISIDTLNLVSTMAAPVALPTFPLIDAAAFNEKPYGIADQILNEQQLRINQYQEVLINTLKDKISSEIIIGSQINNEEVKKFKVEKGGIGVDNKHFPVVFFADGDMNITDLKTGKNPAYIFKTDPQIRTDVARFAASAGVGNVLVSFTRLSVLSVGIFGTSGNIRLESFLFLFNSDGILVLDLYGYTKYTNIGGRDIDDYKDQMDQFGILAQSISLELSKYIQ